MSAQAATKARDAIAVVVDHARRIATGDAPVRPGTPAVINAAASVGDAVWQGDLCLEVIDAIPDGHVLVASPTDADRQLVPGNTQGSRHALDALDGVTLYRPAGWPDVDATLIGPAFTLGEERTVVHPTHGPVTIAAGHAILCAYQKTVDAERRIRRNAD